MAVVKTTRVWDGITLNEFTDTSTGTITLKSPSGVTLASSEDNSWVTEDLTSLTRLYNNAKFGSRIQTELTEAQVKKEFYNQGIKLFNEDRASVLNNTSNYNSNTESDNNRSAFFVKKIPGVIQPTTKRSITSQGGLTSINSFGTEPQTSSGGSNFSLRSLGSSAKSSSGGAAGLRYPLGQLPELGYDFVQFIAHEYEGGGGGLTVKNAEDRLGPATDTIILPIVGGISESNSVGWGGDTLNPLQAVLGQVAYDAIENLSTGDIGKTLGDATTDLKDAMNEVAKDDAGAMDALKYYFAGQAVGANLLTRGTGQVINNNLELLFEGPQLRTFNFNFKLRPRNQEESQVIKKIIRAFKKNMAPKRSEGNIFLLTPNIFTIKYTMGSTGSDHPYMNKIKPCALRNFGVNYSPDNSYMTFADGGLTGYDITLTFGEILPIYADDQENAEGMGY